MGETMNDSETKRNGRKAVKQFGKNGVGEENQLGMGGEGIIEKVVKNEGKDKCRKANE